MAASGQSSRTRVDEILQAFGLGNAVYHDIMLRMKHAMEKGLSIADRSVSSVKMYPSFVTDVPTGNGNFSYCS